MDMYFWPEEPGMCRSDCCPTSIIGKLIVGNMRKQGFTNKLDASGLSTIPNRPVQIPTFSKFC